MEIVITRVWRLMTQRRIVRQVWMCDSLLSFYCTKLYELWCLFDLEYSVFWLLRQKLLYGEKFSCSCEDGKKPERMPRKLARKHSCRQLGFWLILQILLSGEFFSNDCEDWNKPERTRLQPRLKCLVMLHFFWIISQMLYMENSSDNNEILQISQKMQLGMPLSSRRSLLSLDLSRRLGQKMPVTARSAACSWLLHVRC